MKKKHIIFIAITVFAMAAIIVTIFLFNRKLELPKLEKDDILSVHYHTSAIDFRELDIEEFLGYYNEIYDIRNNKEGAGTTADTRIIIELKDGQKIGISNSGDQFEVDFTKSNGKRCQYWGKQQEIANMLDYGVYGLNSMEDVDDKETFKYEIDFPQSAQIINPNLVIKNNLNVNKVENSELLSTYYIVKEEISDDRKEDIKEAFDMENVKGSVSTKDGLTIEEYKRGEEELTIYSNGTFRYKMNANNAQMKNVDFEENMLIEQAETFLKNNDLIPGDFTYSEIGETVIENVSTGEKTVVTKELYFNREIDGIEVEGTSKIMVSINGDCEIEEVYSSYGEIEKSVAVEENYDLDEMVNRLKALKGTIYINENADEITFDDVEVIYYEDSAPYGDNITIQPIYRVRGSSLKDGEEIDEFLGLTSAVKR
ncbi:MAG: hypothetical protein IJD58_10245 [Lachnospiraceae bacterium]|nr:hypothetical protein [Lachnospiraceae bacterium]